MNGNISKTIAVVLSSALLAAAVSGCAGNNGGAASTAESSASGQSMVSSPESKTGSGESTPASSGSTSQQSAEPSAQTPSQSSDGTSAPDSSVQTSEPQSSGTGAAVVEPSFLSNTAGLTVDRITDAYIGTNGGASSLTLAVFDDSTAALLAGTMTGSTYSYEAAVFGQYTKESDMDTYDENGFGAVYSITNASGQKLTFSITGTKTGPGSENVSINIDGVEDVYTCQEAAAEEAASAIMLQAQLFTGADPSEQSSPAAPEYPAFFKELAAVQEKDITFALAGETNPGAELIYVEIADGTQNGKALVITARGGISSGPSGYDIALMGSCSDVARGVTGGNSSASLTVTDAEGNSVNISVTQADEPGMFYAEISGYDDQFIAEQMTADDTLPVLQALAVAAGADPGILSGDDDGGDDDDDDPELIPMHESGIEDMDDLDDLDDPDDFDE